MSNVPELYFDGRMSGQGWLRPMNPGDRATSPTFTVADTGKPVTIVLAWTDVPAVAGVASHLVNNLDLKITPNVCTPSGQFMFYGNYISTSTEQSTNICGFGFIQDQSNNVEVVYARRQSALVHWGAASVFCFEPVPMVKSVPLS